MQRGSRHTSPGGFSRLSGPSQATVCAAGVCPRTLHSARQARDSAGLSTHVPAGRGRRCARARRPPRGIVVCRQLPRTDLHSEVHSRCAIQVRPWGAVLHSRLRLLHLSLRACPAWRPRPQPAPHAAHRGRPRAAWPPGAPGGRWGSGSDPRPSFCHLDDEKPHCLPLSVSSGLACNSPVLKTRRRKQRR